MNVALFYVLLKAPALWSHEISSFHSRRNILKEHLKKKVCSPQLCSKHNPKSKKPKSKRII